MLNVDPPFFEKKDLLSRSRINDLLLEASGYSMATVVAGTGFGKTEAVSDFAKKITAEGKAKVIWLSLREEDNDPGHFRDNVAKTLQLALPDFDVFLTDIRSLDPMAEVQEIALRLSRRLSPKKKVIVVVDNFERLSGGEVRRLFRELVSMFQVNTVCWLIISKTKYNIEMAGLHAKGGLFEITQAQMEFAPDEVKDFFESTGLELNAEQLDVVMESTEGWPLAVDLVSKMLRLGESYNINVCYEHIGEILDEDYFEAFPEELRHLLERLSLLRVFSPEVLDRLAVSCGASPVEARELIDAHAFIRFNYISETYRLHKVYQNYLLRKQRGLPPEEKRQLYDSVGRAFYSEGRLVEAIECYVKNENHLRALQITDELVLHQLDTETCDYIASVLRDFPDAFCRENPLVDLLWSYIDLYRINIAASEARLQELCARLECEKSREGLTLLGEALLLLAVVSIMKNSDDFAQYLKKAAQVFPAGERIHSDIKFLFDTNCKLFLVNNEERELERLRDMIRSCIPYIEHFQTGAGVVFAGCYSLEVAYCTYDLEVAEKLAYQYITTSREAGLCYSVLHGRWKMLLIAYMSGDLEKALVQLELIREYAGSRTDPVCIFMRDQIEACFHVLMGDLHNVPRWFKNHKSPERDRLPIFFDTLGSVYAYYLLKSGEYIGLIYYLNWFENQYASTGTWLNILVSKILRAVAFMKLGEEESAVSELWKAYQLSYKNNIITPFIGAGKHMRTLIALAERSGQYDFPKKWLNLIRQKSSTYAKRSAVMENAYYAKMEQGKPRDKLTKREFDVLTALAHGLTREEIASMSDVTPGTIKTIIKQIYNKLDAVNNAAAIRIAYETGIFKPEGQEEQ